MSHNLDTIPDKTADGAKVLCLIPPCPLANLCFYVFSPELAAANPSSYAILDTNIKLSDQRSQFVFKQEETALEITGLGKLYLKN